VSGARLISYPELRVLENAAHGDRVVPTRIFALLLPIWCVEVRATVTEAEDYELIDRHLEKAIAEAGLHTVAELAQFFALDRVVVDRALRFLTAIEHVAVAGDRFTLTELGKRSVRDQKSYRVTVNDHRKLYFDGYGSRPLTRPYYDSGAVTFLEPADLSTVAGRDGPAFTTLANMSGGFRREALTELASRPDRDAFNLPARIDSPESLGETIVYLPVYLVRGLQPGGRSRYLAFSQIDEEADPYLTGLCEQTPEIVGVCENDTGASNGTGCERISEWLRKRNLGGQGPELVAGGQWRVTFKASAFEGALGLSKVGSYVVLGNTFFHVWCTDRRTRQAALVERLNAYLGARSHVDEDLVRQMLTRLATQLKLDADLPTVRRWAVTFGKTTLAEQLASFG
jgi:hypothetical protein